MLSYFLLGAAAGAITGIPIGPVNVAIIDAAYRHHVKRAIAVGLGGALGDFLYAAVGILGLGRILDAHPALPPILYGISGLALIAYGVVTVRTQPVDSVATTDAVGGRGYFWNGFGLGLALILLNPAALITWAVVVGPQLAGGGMTSDCAAAIGIGAGSLAWFTFVAYAADHGKKVLGAKAKWVTRVVGMLLIGAGVFSLGRATYYVVQGPEVALLAKYAPVVETD